MRDIRIFKLRLNYIFMKRSPLHLGILMFVCFIVNINAAYAQRVESFPLSQVTILGDDGVFSKWADNERLDSAWMMSFSVKRLLHNFQTTAGVFAGLEGGYSGKQKVEKLGGWESMDCDLRGHAVGHLLSAYALAAAGYHGGYIDSGYSGLALNPFKLKGDSLVQGLRECQQMMGTGYISAFPEGLLKRNLEGKSVWAPWYTLHKIISGLILQYKLCHNETALAICKDFCKWADRFLGGVDDATRQRALRNEFGGIGQSFYELYLITGDKADKRLSDFFYQNEKMDSLYAGNFNMGTMHCNTFLPKVMAEVMKGREGREGVKMGDAFWHSIVNNHVLAPGCLSDKEHFFDPLQTSKHLTGNTGETCCTYNMLKLTRELYAMNPDDPMYFDYYERALYNHILGQQDPQTGMVHYFLPTMTGAYKLYSTYDKSFWCCVGSGFESHAKYGESIYWRTASHPGPLPSRGKGVDTIYVNLFIPSELHADGLNIRMDTKFPLSEAVKLTIDTKKAFVLKVRRPSWTGKKGYDIYKVKAGRSIISFKEKMQIRTEATPDDRNRIAVFYGPVLLAGQLGHVDNPFSDPTKHNDYYGFDYKVPSELKVEELKVESLKRTGALEWITDNGIKVKPLYDTHRERYVIYWNKKL